MAFNNEDILEYIRENLDSTSYSMAKLLKKIYGNNYRYSNSWYFYDENKNIWMKLKGDFNLKEKIPTEVANFIWNVMHKYAVIFENYDKNAIDRDIARSEYKRFLKIQNCLSMKSFMDITMKMAETDFLDDTFTRNLNKDPYLFACANGILQMRVKTGENPQEHVLLRAGTREDSVSFLAGHNFPEYEGINYIPYDPSNPVFGEINAFFNKIFPNRDLRDYFLRLIASSLEGTTDHMVYLWKGAGGNGKSKVLELVRMVFGDYQTSIPSSILSSKKPGKYPSMKNIRFMHSHLEGSSLNRSVIKQLVGDDSIQSKDEGEFKNSSKIHIHCNSTPIMDATTRRSIRIIPFESTFVNADDPDLGKPNVFLREDLDKKLLAWREPFLSLLVHIYETQYLKNGLGVPDVVKKANNEFREDSFILFQKERVRDEVGVETTFKMIERCYKKWHVTSNGRLRALNPIDLLKRINEEWGEPIEGKYFNKRVFIDEEEVAEFDAK